MITVLSYLEKLNNIPVLQEEFHSQAAFHSEEDWRYFLYTKLEELRKQLPLKDDFLTRLNFNSLETCNGYAEKALATVEAGSTYQFPRVGYFCKDTDSTAGKYVFNRVVGLKDTFAKQIKK